MDGTLSGLRKEMITAVNLENQIIPDGSFRRTHQQNSPKPRRRRRVPPIKKEPRNVGRKKVRTKRKRYDDDDDNDDDGDDNDDGDEMSRKYGKYCRRKRKERGE